jgi:hypothetical protein
MEVRMFAFTEDAAPRRAVATVRLSKIEDYLTDNLGTPMLSELQHMVKLKRGEAARPGSKLGMPLLAPSKRVEQTQKKTSFDAIIGAWSFL